jgi:hypothetical protein
MFNGLKTVIANDRNRAYEHGIYPESEGVRGFTPPSYQYGGQRSQQGDTWDRNRAGPSRERYYGAHERR